MLLVIEGADSTGKETQTKLLSEKFSSKGRPVETIDFPSKTSFFGKLIYEGLAGKYGDFKSLHPKLASTFWAADRYLAKEKMMAWLNEGKIVIADRYVSANQLHQGGKITNEEERQEFLEWLDVMEHHEYGIPRPQKIFYLDLPFEISLRLLKERKAKQATSLEGNSNNDQHEDSPEHQIAARDSAIKMLSNDSWVRIQCSDDGTNILPKEVIHGRIWTECLKLF